MYTSKDSYAISVSMTGGGTVSWDEIKLRDKTQSSFEVSYDIHSWIAIGY